MINRGATLVSRLAVVLAILFAFTACGGGGGGGDAFYQGSNDNRMRLGLFDSQGNRIETITSSAPVTLTVSISDNGSSVVVSAETTLGTLEPASGTALTDGSGTARFLLYAGAEKGAGIITATATTEDGELTATLGFQVGDRGLRLGYFDDDGDFIENEILVEPASTLSAGGNAQLSVTVLNAAGERVTTAEAVRFSSGCIAAGQASINPVDPQSVNGVASTLYTADGCTGTDEVTASLVGASGQAFASISIASPQANAVNFVSAEPTLIVLRGTGGGNRDETSDVVFKVVDGTGAPLQGVTVNFSLSTEVGGLTLSKTSALSDGEGQVRVTVSSGDIATTVRVIATVVTGGQTIATASDLLTVTTGLPDQNSISLSVTGGFVVENGMRVDGVVRTLNVAMADKFNNPVVNGTGAVFTTEYGAIIGSCTTVDGRCSVEWRSQEPRFPTLTGETYVRTIFGDPEYDCRAFHNGVGPCPADLGYINGGRSTILVHAIGEESFIDANGNGIMDEAERDLFQNLPEAFIDQNEDGLYTPVIPECADDSNASLQCIAGQEEIFIDFNNNQQYDFNDDPAWYNGLLCPPEGNGVWCSRELVNVRDDQVVILGDTDYYIILVRDRRIVSDTEHGETQFAYMSDIFNNRPPAGSTVSVSVTGDCELKSPASFTVPNNASYGAYAIEVVTGPPDEPPTTPDPGTLRITLTPTGGPAVTEIYDCDTFTVEPPCEDFSPPNGICDDEE